VKSATATPVICAGDCDASGDVEVAELIRAVRIALEHAALDSCASVDNDGDGLVAINELLIAVAHALRGC
jgi:hypothetical protein